jgi:NAD(P)-dependent dehydrogenase (short-subunit alcohol dehydrogenase family)
MSGPPRETGWALVTGGGRRLGADIVRGLAHKGWNVAIHYNGSAEEAERLSADVARSFGVKSLLLKADLAAAEAASALPIEASRLAGAPLSLIVNNASIFEFDRAGDFAAADFDRHFIVNARAPALICQAYARSLPAGAEGAVVNILDQKLWNLNPEFFTYTLSKAALLYATKTLAMALAPRIRVNAVAPGLIFPSGDQTPEEFAAYVEKYNLLKRPIRIEDVVDAVIFLATCRSATGAIIHVDNGQHLAPSQHDVRFNSREFAV